MIDPAELSRALAALLEQGQVEVHEDSQLLPGLAQPRYEVSRQGDRVLLHLWSDEQNLVRRVLGVADEAPGCLLLEVQRFGRAKPGRLELRVRETRLQPGTLTRRKFLAVFRQLLAEQFPDEDVASLTASPDLEHSFSGCYPRGVTRQQRRAWAVLGVSPQETAATIDGALAFGLLWLAWTREHAPRKVVEGLWLILPSGTSATTAHRLQGLAPTHRIELYELDAERLRLRLVDPKDFGNVDSRLTLRRDSEQLLSAASVAIDRVRALAPEAIDAVVVPGAREVALRFRGLEFARWQSGALFALNSEGRLEPCEPHSAALRERVAELARHRRPDPPTGGTQHPLYRAQGERWLESLVVADAGRIEPRLDPRFTYAQVPAFASTDRAVLDLLGATRDGRLVVIELKVSEDIQLALQALDYWLRVCWHQRQGDFQSLGYFSGLPLQVKPPLLYVVAPGLRFHPATDTVLKFFSPEVELVRVGLNENWREGLRVVFRQ